MNNAFSKSISCISLTQVGLHLPILNCHKLSLSPVQVDERIIIPVTYSQDVISKGVLFNGNLMAIEKKLYFSERTALCSGTPDKK